VYVITIIILEQRWRAGDTARVVPA
jgi:hypothetical protein